MTPAVMAPTIGTKARRNVSSITGNDQRTADQPEGEADGDAFDDAQHRGTLEVPAARVPSARGRLGRRRVASPACIHRSHPLRSRSPSLSMKNVTMSTSRNPMTISPSDRSALQDGVTLSRQELTQSFTGRVTPLVEVGSGDVERAVVHQPIGDVVDALVDRRPQLVDLTGERGADPAEHRHHADDQHQQRDGGRQGRLPASSVKGGADRATAPG